MKVNTNPTENKGPRNERVLNLLNIIIPKRLK